jgi:hypothetical protein
MDAPTDYAVAINERKARRLFVVGCCIFFGILAVQYFVKVHHNPYRSAFLRWSNQLEDLRQGEDIWDKHNYPNPPIMALILLPFTQLPHLVGALAWFVLKAGLTLLAIHWVWRMLERDGPVPLWGKLVGLALVVRPIEGDLSHGNVNLFILFLVTASLYAFTRRRDWLSGLLLGLAVACKLTPALFIPYLAWKRAWKTLVGCGAGLVLFLGLVPGLLVGFERNAEYLGSWIDNMVLPYVLENRVTSEHQNQSLPGLLHRLLTFSPSFSERTEAIYYPLEHHNLVDLDPGVVQMLVKVLLAGFCVLVMWTCRTPTRDRRDWRLVAEFALIVLGMLLFSERTWKHHCVTLLFPGAVLGLALAKSGLAPGSRRVCWTCLAAALVFMSATGAPVPAFDRLGDLAQVYGAYVWAFLFLVLPLARLLRARSVVEPRAHIFQARISCMTLAETRGIGLPVRSWTSVSGSMPSR